MANKVLDFRGLGRAIACEDNKMMRYWKFSHLSRCHRPRQTLIHHICRGGGCSIAQLTCLAWVTSCTEGIHRWGTSQEEGGDGDTEVAGAGSDDYDNGSGGGGGGGGGNDDDDEKLRHCL